MKASSVSMIVAACLAFAAAAHADSSTTRSYLLATGVDADAVGSVAGVFKDSRSVLSLTVSKLAATTDYEFVVDGVVQGRFTTSTKGAGVLRFIAPKYRNELLLDFDPRGKTVAVMQGGVSVLEGVFAGAGAAGRSTEAETAYLHNEVAGTPGRCYARFTRSSSGVESFIVAASRTPSGVAQVLINGQHVGEMKVVRGSGVLRFRSGTPSGSTLPLNFDPRGAAVDVLQNGTLLFSGNMKARAFGANVERRSTVLMMIPATTVPAPGTARAKWEVTEKARRKFSVEIEDAAPGSYDLMVAGVPRGVIQVIDNGMGDVEGEIEFSNDDDGDELPLVFDVLGQTLTIAQAGATLFEGVFDPSVLNTRPAAEPPSRLEEDLASTGADPNASAKARYDVDDKGRHRFGVEIEDVDAGTYSLRVGGVHRASIRAAVKSGGVEGEVEFRSVTEPGKILLNFDPRGQLLEIVNAAGDVMFSHTLGAGSAAPGSSGTAVLPLQVGVALFAEPGVTGTVRVTFERKTNGDEKLKVMALNLPVGAYDVSVGGVVRGTLNVVVSGGETEGELEFENEPEGPSELHLNFAILGQDVVVSQGGTMLFSRVMPAE